MQNKLEMTTRGIRRKKSTLTELKIAVIGSPGVGKSGKKIDGGASPFIGISPPWARHGGLPWHRYSNSKLVEQSLRFFFVYI